MVKLLVDSENCLQSVFVLSSGWKNSNKIYYIIIHELEQAIIQLVSVDQISRYCFIMLDLGHCTCYSHRSHGITEQIEEVKDFSLNGHLDVHGALMILSS